MNRSNSTGKLENVIIQDDNVRSHVANMTRHAITELAWDVMPYLPYSPDLDSHHFRLLPKSLNDVSFNNDADLKTRFD